MPLTNRNDLGTIVKIYRGRQIGLLELFILFIPGSLAVLTPLAYGIWRSNYGYTQFGPVAALAWSSPWYLLASFAALALICLAWLRLRTAHSSIAIHRGGLNLSLSPLHQYSLPWPEVTGLITDITDHHFLGIPLNRRIRLTLLTKAHKPIHLDDRIRDLENLSQQIKRIYYPYVRTNMVDARGNGKDIPFGPLTMTRSGLRLGTRMIDWEQMCVVKIDSGFLVVESGTSDQLRLPLARLPNPEILIDLLQESFDVQS